MAGTQASEQSNLDTRNIDEKTTLIFNRFLFEVYVYAKENNIKYLLDKYSKISNEINRLFK